MSGNDLVVEQAEVLAMPENHQADEPSDDFIFLDGPEKNVDEPVKEAPNPTKTEKAEKTEKPEKVEKVEDEAEEPADDEDEAEDKDEAPSVEDDGDDEDAELAKLASGEPEKPAKLSGSARLKAKLAEAQAEIERLRQVVPKADESKALTDAVEREIGPAPKESDFADYLQFSKAETAYETMKLMVTRELKREAERAKTETETRNNTIVETFKDRANGVRKFVKDFDAVMQSASVAPENAETKMLILESDKGPQLAYYLAKHPDKVHELNAMPARKQLAEIGRLEARLSTPKPKTVTKAPAPVPPLTSSAAPKDKTIDEADKAEKMDMDSFADWFDKRKRSRA